MNFEDLERELEAGKLRPVYAALGSEALLRDDAIARIRAAVLEGASPAFDFQRLRGDEADAVEFGDAVRALPMLAPRRLVHLVNPEAGRGARTKALLAALVEAVSELSGQTQIVLAISAAKVDRRSRWVKALAGAVVDCDPPRGLRAVASFVRREAGRQQVALDSAAASLLAERVGPQLLMLRQEIAKAALLAGPDTAVTRAVVERSTRSVAEKPIWDLTDAIGEGRLGDALELLSGLQRGGAAAPVILGALAAHFRKLSRIDGGGSVAGPPFAVRKLSSQARRYSSGRLRACLDAIHETDTAIKGAGVLPPDLAVERLVLALAS